MSKPLAFARVPATRPSGLIDTSAPKIVWSRILSTTGSAPRGVVASRSICAITASTPSYSSPWIEPWKSAGALIAVPAAASFAIEAAGSVSAVACTAA